MNTFEINKALAAGDVITSGVLPKLEELSEEPFVFQIDFGLSQLPEESGVILIRGARQYGKSTWLQEQIKATVQQFGPGTAFYLNGDELRDWAALIEQIRMLLPHGILNIRVVRKTICALPKIDRRHSWNGQWRRKAGEEPQFAAMKFQRL